MNGFSRLGVAIAVAPALSLALAEFVGSADLATVSGATLTYIALPLGGLLVLIGVVVTARRRIQAAANPAIQATVTGLGTAWRHEKARQWIIAFVLVGALAFGFGGHAHNPGDQTFLDAVNFLLMLFGGTLIMTLLSVLRRQPPLALVGKAVALCALLAVVGVLVLLSALLRTPWGSP